ncbi:exodeoxyribonuclease V subunit beta [Paraflavitalea sp. CAU 1676]|uniref:exodeoxyribonuclease V subunit beta n=1 Tax=Paraflavitalea sp. CAU 1676 TaxID=3032598 RepID=UPI0023DA6995|nr:exodeoxyribonuclease V subunit beta [Paraflavitalea sp. CAU 1676]MDF2187579.1 exodeoxyribonuclease V subunit beta [Paraflavitalea sp. CAU 1676]
MIETKQYIEFEAATVPLEDSNLIEASAGTGKTYSIAILVLRLVLEKKISVKEILMVTFTKAAVAELEERVRLFIRTAHKFAEGQEITDTNIAVLVQQAVDQAGHEAVLQQLNDAVLLLDETSVLTIHSFCQQALNEFAFETFQLFGAEMLPDFTPVVEDEMNRFWRRSITTLPFPLLRLLWHKDLKANITEVLKNHQSGKRYPGFDENTTYSFDKKIQDEWLQLLTGMQQNLDKSTEALHHYIAQNADHLRTQCESNTHAKKGLLPLVGDPAALAAAIGEKKTTQYVVKLFPDLLQHLARFEAEEEAKENALQNIYQQINHFAIQEVGKGIAAYKERHNVLGYDDLIGNLHRALVERNNQKLVEVLRKKYKAVFIDEFQDTDRQQFEIFDKAFGEHTILFYIGDPKQSIYAWRKADIFTYFKARDSVQHLYGMNHNYRSSKRMIEGMNQFFLPQPNFDTFYFEQQEDVINYIAVESPESNSKGSFLANQEEEAAITICSCAKSALLLEAVARQVAWLLNSDRYLIDKKGNKRKPIPTDIGILVRTGAQGRDIKQYLSRLGIPSVTIDDAKVLQSEEANYLLYLMEAIASPDRSSINRALLSPFTGFDTAQILSLDDGVVLELFSAYKNRWAQDGIYTALMHFVSDFRVRQVLLSAPAGNGERVITNLFQLIELVHQAENRKNLSAPELLSWLKRGIDGMTAEGDEYIQRMESDEEAVRIVTIHKSKGLEYNIVLAPFLDFTENKRQEFISFRDPETGDYIGAERSRLNEQQLLWYQQQAEQENRRLLYVAITRAVYTCYIFRNLYYKSSTLATFVQALASADPSLIAFTDDVPEAPSGSRKQSIATSPKYHPSRVNFVLKEEHWRKLSYTLLAAHQDQAKPPGAFPLPVAYDNFVFYELRRGAKTGNFLHFIFENIHFGDDSRWDKWLEEAIRRFAPGQQEMYQPMLKEMLQQVLYTNIGGEATPFTLSDIAWQRKMTEFEFDFPVPGFAPEALHALADDQSAILIRTLYGLPGNVLEGMMNGKIDLFFEHEGRYYILDWKSNYLGNTLANYSPESIAQAMNEHNYHLQYLIYTVAVKKYLESRLGRFDYDTQFGGVVYLFVRGVRANSETGIFTHKPSFEKIQALERILG